MMIDPVTPIYPWPEWKANIDIQVARWEKTLPDCMVAAGRDDLIRSMLADNLLGVSKSGGGQGLDEAFAAINAFEWGDREQMWAQLENQPFTPPVICLEGAVSKSSMAAALSHDRSASSAAESLPYFDP